MAIHSDALPSSPPASESGSVHEGHAAACRDCGHPLSAGDRFCSACGQPTRIHPPTLWEFVHEWLQHYVALEGKLWKSLWALMARPGFLTLEYLAGRRQRYVQPLRLLLTLGVLFFLFLKLGAPADFATVDVQVSPASALPASAPQPAASAPQPAASVAAPGIGLPEAWAQMLPAKVRQQFEAANARASADPQAELRRLGKAMLGMAPYAVLVSLPFFAGLLKLLFRRRIAEITLQQCLEQLRQTLGIAVCIEHQTVVGVGGEADPAHGRLVAELIERNPGEIVIEREHHLIFSAVHRFRVTQHHADIGLWLACEIAARGIHHA